MEGLTVRHAVEGAPTRRLPVGAEVLADAGVSFRVWAPKRRHVELVLFSDSRFANRARAIDLAPEGNGYLSTFVPSAAAGMRYAFQLEGESQLRPDPASRFQPEGPEGASEIVDPSKFDWTDSDWRGLDVKGQVLYEMHVGTFTPEGTFESAMRELPELAKAGMTTIELMPVADFPGAFGWGYDGVCMFAPSRLYGRPDDLRAFVDAAHALGLGVILDVVFNHFGNVHNYVTDFADDYVTTRYKNEWSGAINFDGPHSGPVREFFIANGRYWIEEFHFDGFRFDATQALFDSSSLHIAAEIADAARAAAPHRQLYMAGENEPQDVRTLAAGGPNGMALDALWNDDFHHAAMVRLTGAAEAYYSDYRGSAHEFVGCVKRGFLYQGQYSRHQSKRRGSSTRGLAAQHFITFLQNHDQVANSASGQRIDRLASPGCLRAMTALWLLSPQTPLFFQGQEYASSKPFYYFADFERDHAQAVADGRADFLKQFPTLATHAAREHLMPPHHQAAFMRSKLDHSERQRHAAIYTLHKDLLRLRREDPVFSRQDDSQIDGVALSSDCLLLRFFTEQGGDRFLLVNFGVDWRYSPLAEPLLAPPANRHWQVLWHSEDFKYEGRGQAPIEADEVWHIPGHAAAVLQAIE